MNFDPSLIEATQCYKLMVASITPRPIAWISTLSVTGVLNLTPYSFFTVASCNPPVLAVTQVNPRDRAAKDTLTNLRATGECVVNIVSEDHAAVMNASCANYPPELSEFAELGIASVPSSYLTVSGVDAAKVRYECRLRDVIEVSSLPMGGTMILLDVINIFVNDEILVNGHIAPHLINTIGKLGGDLYTTTHERFEMARPELT